MKYRLCLFSFCLLFFGLLNAEAPSNNSDFDEVQKACILNIDGICETEYVEEVLELCKDCDIPTPEPREPWTIEVWVRTWGIACLYKYFAFKSWVSEKVYGSSESKDEE